ncbi:phosphatidylinositol glycan anchor biosynthesis class U protein-like isoform X1 [Asparagus officinalis]|uniref:phosphatidylinositol glycan anchor biosynthesis class U protein-like isoform X1 n=1 Tax=Asparagus officinalis TaxID=4686 RepID=UPI00098E4A42|nr:phosphatidylinositol glycan anchor biosynthesis class U protein-like isoform X1 [Asparagus officinalis]
MAEIRWYWPLVAASLAIRIVLIFCFTDDLNLASVPEVTTPLTSLRRLAEGYWLKQASMSPYSGSMYHGSPLLLPILGPLTVKRVDGVPTHIFYSLIFVIVDLITAMLIRATGRRLLVKGCQNMQLLNLENADQGKLDTGDLASLVFLWNPLTIITCVGSSTSPIDNLMVVLAIYGACSRIVPLAAFGWVMATHLSLYPAILIVPVILLLGYGLDAPPPKLFLLKNSNADESGTSKHVNEHKVTSQTGIAQLFSWKPIIYFVLWASIWSCYVLFLSVITLKGFNGLSEMLRKTHGFILTVEDLSPNIGLLWYFFAEVFDFFRSFFLIVFHLNILFMILPLAIRLNHRPCFLAFVFMALASMLKSYPSVGDSALYLGLLGLFANELAEMHFPFFLFCGYVGVSLLSPVMHNLWIWRGTGNANFYFATGLGYACLQTVLIVESVSTMLNHDRKLRKQLSHHKIQ